MITRLLLLLIYVSATVAVPGNVTIRECPLDWPGLPETDYVNITRMTIEGCISDPCVLIKSEPVITDFAAVIGIDIDSTNKLEYKMFVIPKGMAPLLTVRGDICQFWESVNVTKGFCNDIKAGKEVKFTVTSRIPDVVPSIEVNVLSMILKDDVCKACAYISIIIKDKEFNIKNAQERIGGFGALGGGFLAG